MRFCNLYHTVLQFCLLLWIVSYVSTGIFLCLYHLACSALPLAIVTMGEIKLLFLKIFFCYFPENYTVLYGDRINDIPLELCNACLCSSSQRT